MTTLLLEFLYFITQDGNRILFVFGTLSYLYFQSNSDNWLNSVGNEISILYLNITGRYGLFSRQLVSILCVYIFGPAGRVNFITDLKFCLNSDTLCGKTFRVKDFFNPNYPL